MVIWSFSPVAAPEIRRKHTVAPVGPGSLLEQPISDDVAERAVLLGSILRFHHVASQMWDVSALHLCHVSVPMGSCGFHHFIVLCFCSLVTISPWVHDSLML